MHADTASKLWAQLDGKRSMVISTAEVLTKLTVPRLMYDDEEDPNLVDSTQDYQSVGAYCLNHMSNRTVQTMFPVGRGFFKLDPTSEVKKLAESLGVDETGTAGALTKHERSAVKALDASGQRPKITRAVSLALATGNSLIVDAGDSLIVHNLRKFVVRRMKRSGKIRDLIIRETELYQDLSDEVKLHIHHRTDDTAVELFTWVHWDGKQYVEDQWVGDVKLPTPFSRTFKADELPYLVLNWNLADGKNYGTGLVEDYWRDFTALSALGQSGTDGAVACSQNRVLVDPGSTLKVEDFNRTVNNEAVAGTPDNVANLTLGNPQGVQITLSQFENIERRVKAAFMVTSAVQRNAERVTAYELRLMANELDTQHGGTYSAMATTLQPFIAKWCLRQAKVDTRLFSDVRIVTGADALGRAGDVDNVRLAFEDLTSAATLPEEVRTRLDWDKLIKFIGDGRQTPLSDFILTQAQQQSNTAAGIEANAANTFATTAAEQAAMPNA
jgi:Bacteriophage head to tail connecting protein